MPEFEAIKTDICVIGAGAAGLSVASSAALLGVPVVLIEKGAMGGDCLNRGCVPSKTLLASAHAAVAGRNARDLGVQFRAPGIDAAAIIGRLRRIRAEIAPMDSVERYRALGVRVVQEQARFIDSTTVEAGRYRISARRFIIATGASPSVPDIPGLTEVPFLTSDTVFEQEELPKRLAVLGGGAIGVELAQAYRRLGAAVTIIEKGLLLAQEDPEAVAVVRRQLRREGVEVLERTEVRRVQALTSGLTLDLETERGLVMLNKGSLLIAVGREPDLDSLNLAAAGVDHGPRGIVVDDRLRTSSRRILAIGDCTGTRSTHSAAYQASVALRNALFPFKTRIKANIVPSVVYSDPEMARVGLSEVEALASGKGVQILRWPFSETDRARTDGDTEGFVKAMIDGKGRILGAAIVGHGAGELIAPWSLAISQGLKIGAMIDMVAPYPTRTEASRRAALQALMPKLRNPWLGRIVRWARALG